MFLICRGAYSDISNIGIFHTEDEAMKYCAMMNSKDSELDRWNAYWYTEVNEIEADVSSISLVFNRHVSFWFDYNDSTKTIKFCQKEGHSNGFMYAKEGENFEEYEGNKYNIFAKDKRGWIRAWFLTQKEEVAEKACQDLCGQIAYEYSTGMKLEDVLHKFGFTHI